MHIRSHRRVGKTSGQYEPRPALPLYQTGKKEPIKDEDNNAQKQMPIETTQATEFKLPVPSEVTGFKLFTGLVT